jgi:shikimate dehydrogenase
MISGKTSIYGIFGHPVEHTFSPGMHNAAFRALGLNACYVPFPVSPTDLPRAARAIIPLGLRGLNITVPHKEKIIPFLDKVAEDALAIGAVNTIEVRGDMLIGHNTDGRGFLRSLSDVARFRPRGKVIAIIGAGGAARAVGCSLALAGAGNVLLYDMDMRKARRLARDISRNFGKQVHAIDADRFSVEARSADCLINATPLGLRRDDPLPCPSDVINSRQLVCDLVYNPANTKLLLTARSKGARTLGGIGMLLYQGVIAFEIWTSKKAPVPVMRKALARQMSKRGK